MNKFIILIFGLSLTMMTSNITFAQNAIKLDKQTTNFFYTQLNLQGGYSNNNGGQWDVANFGNKNQLSFQWLSLNQRQLQKGYIKTFLPIAYKLKLVTPFSSSRDVHGDRTAKLQLALADAWVKFGTKRDRTTITIGNETLSYGNNPNLDLVAGQGTNLAKSDLGMSRDMGVFVKTPLTKNLDIEFSLSTGGMFNQPIMTTRNLMKTDAEEVEEEEETNPAMVFADYAYDKTFLLVSRICTPPFKKHEWGITTTTGRISNPFLADDKAFVNRLGGDWVYKHFEKLKFGTQATFGHTKSEAEGNFASLGLQSSGDIMLFDNFILSASFVMIYHNSLNTDLYHLRYTNTNSLSYAISPHTRLRLNQYFSKSVETNDVESGVYLQFVTGIGRR